MKLVFGVLMFLISSIAFSSDCNFSNTTITDIERWDNGEIFVYFGKTDNNCPCSQKGRLAIPTGSENDFLKSQILMAIASSKTINAVGRPREDGYCTIHGNTAELIRLRIKHN